MNLLMVFDQMVPSQRALVTQIALVNKQYPGTTENANETQIFPVISIAVSNSQGICSRGS